MALRKQKGVSLIEILLVLMVATIIITWAVMYFSQSIQYSRVSQAVNTLQQINKAGYEWLQISGSNGVYPENFKGSTDKSIPAISMQQLVDLQLIPCENKSCFNDAWGGEIKVQPGENPRYMLITMSQLPASDCAHMKEQMKNIIPKDVNLSNQNACLTKGNLTSYQVYL